MKQKINLYFSLTKPGVLLGNVLTAVAGFLFASGTTVNTNLFIATTTGMSLVIASACVLNNYFDRDIDSVMKRTKKRAIASGAVTGRSGVIFAVILGILGILVLYRYTNLLVVSIGILGFVVYVWLYGMFSKRMSVHGTLVGSISGAMPILAGYCAVTGSIDPAAIILFLALFFWQLPEFYSIAVYRKDEYKKANVPVISVVKGISHTKKEILFYTVAFVITTLQLTVFGYSGISYFAVMAGFGIYWIYLGVKFLTAQDDDFWGRKMFRFSLIILLTLCLMLSINVFLP